MNQTCVLKYSWNFFYNRCKLLSLDRRNKNSPYTWCKQVIILLLNMDMKLVKQGNENSRSSLPHSLVIINLKADAVMEVLNSTTSRDYSKNDACRSSQNLKGHDRVEGEKIANGSSKSSSGESSRGDELKMCRICHLANWENSNSEALIQLGCGCKNELGTSHLSCAQTWFKLKGNRLCEICGKIALKVGGVEETYRNANKTNVFACLVLALIVLDWWWSGRKWGGSGRSHGNKSKYNSSGLGLGALYLHVWCLPLESHQLVSTLFLFVLFTSIYMFIRYNTTHYIDCI